MSPKWVTYHPALNRWLQRDRVGRHSNCRAKGETARLGATGRPDELSIYKKCFEFSAREWSLGYILMVPHAPPALRDGKDARRSVKCVSMRAQSSWNLSERKPSLELIVSFSSIHSSRTSDSST